MSRSLVSVHIRHIEAIGIPKHESSPCPCGGEITYSRGTLSSKWNGSLLYVDSVCAYRCSNCSVVFLLPGEAKVIDREIAAARQGSKG